MAIVYTVTVFDDRTEWRNEDYKLHREGGLPAVEWFDGSAEYWVNGKCHRDGGLPSVDYVNGNREWWVNDQLHREGGLPAIEWICGRREWWVNGKQITEVEAKKLAIKPNSCDGKIVEIDGKKYQLKEV